MIDAGLGWSSEQARLLYDNRGDSRRLRLAACACFRAAPSLTGDVEEFVDLAERLADGDTTPADFEFASRFDAEVSGDVRDGLPPRWPGLSVGEDMLVRLAHLVTTSFSWLNALSACRVLLGRNKTDRPLAAVLADFFASPYDPVSFDPAWCTPTVAAVALRVYDERAFHDLPILADALQDAGCADERVLGHCRGDSAHYRGCWVLDAALGRLVLADGPPHVPKKKRRT